MSPSPQPASGTPSSSGAAALAFMVAGGAGAGAPLALAFFGAADPKWAIPAAALVGAVWAAAGVWLNAARRRGPEGAAAADSLGALPAATPDSPPPVNPLADLVRAASEPHPLRAALDQVPEPFLLVCGGPRANPDARRYLFANIAARDLLRLTRSDGPLSTAIRAPEVLSAVDEALFANTVAVAAYQPGAGHERSWRVRAAPLAAAAGPSLAVVTLLDDTEVRRGEKARANFLANASHELRTPLASLAGFIDTLRGHAREDAEAREKFLAIMHVQAERMRRLIDDLMSLSRIELGEHISPSGRVDLTVAAIDVADALQPLAAERGVELRLDLPAPGRLHLLADRDQVLQVVQNLIENAVKFSASGQSVQVTAREEDAALAFESAAELGNPLALLAPERGRPIARASLSVRDHGPGIPRADLPRLTERFYRVEGSRTREYPGTGLGLAIVKHIVNRHHGGLWVQSLEGRGARFTVLLPTAADLSESEGGQPIGELSAAPVDVSAAP